MGKTWSPVGETPLIEYNFNWKHLSVIGGITLNGSIHFKVHEGSVNSEVVIEYLSQLLSHIKRHVVLLWDGSPTHRSGVVKDFLEQNKERVTVFRLPPYYPKFNPVEFLWTHLKWSKMKGFCPKQLYDLRKKVNNCVRSIRRRPDIVSSYFRASHIPIGDGAEIKLLKYCKANETTQLCINQ